MKTTQPLSTLKKARPLVALSALAMALVLSACGKQEEVPTTTNAPTTTPAPADSSSSSSSSTTPAEASTPSSAPAAQPQASSGDPAASNAATPSSAPAPGTAAAPSSLSEGVDSTKAAASNAIDTAGVALDDTGITAKVKAELAKDSDLSALSISVSTNGGHVNLSGPAPSAEAKERAEGLVKGIQGVNGVTNNLEVKAGS